MNIGAWVAWERGERREGGEAFRESIRLLKPIGDRATLCESQRGLAELLLVRGRVEEAERYALDARETVGPLDVTSRATTASSLAQVRAAQGRDEEADELFRRRWPPLTTRTFASSSTSCWGPSPGSCASAGGMTRPSGSTSASPSSSRPPQRAPRGSLDVTPHPAPR